MKWIRMPPLGAIICRGIVEQADKQINTAGMTYKYGSNNRLTDVRDEEKMSTGVKRERGWKQENYV